MFYYFDPCTVSDQVTTKAKGHPPVFPSQDEVHARVDGHKCPGDYDDVPIRVVIDGSNPDTHDIPGDVLDHMLDD